MSKHKSALAILLFFFSHFICNAQTENSYQETGILSDDNYNLIQEMVTTFENQLCTYYDVESKDTNRAFYNYIQDLKDSKINIKQLTSDKTSKLLKKSIKTLLGYIWITNKDRRTRWNIKNFGTTEVKYENPDSKIIQEYIQELKATENILSIDYQTNFTENLANNTYIKDLKDVIFTLKNRYESDLPSLVALGLSYIKEEDFSDQNLKVFITFELFYATLNKLNDE